MTEGHVAAVATHYTEEELRATDPLLQPLTGADRKLMGIYEDTIHRNDGTHLDGGIADDAKFQRLHCRLASVRQDLYEFPDGRWANRFLDM